MGGTSNRMTFNDPLAGRPFEVIVDKVVMLGTPNAGTVLADFALGFQYVRLPQLVFQPSWDATKDLTTHHMQSQFDQSWPSNISLYLFAATGGDQSWSLLNASDAVMREINVYLPPEQPGDGAVTRPSVTGRYWYRTLPKLELLSRPCFGGAVVAKASTTDLEIGAAPQDHFSMLSDPTTLTWVIGKLTGNSQFGPSFASRSAQFNEAPILAAAIPAVPPASLQIFAQTGGALATGGSQQISVESDAVQ